MLFNIYIRDIPDTVSCQYGYADELALLFFNNCWNEVEAVLSLDVQGVADYLSAWRLRLSTAKTTCIAFHLNNRESSSKLAVTVSGTTNPYTQNPTYLGVTLDRQLTFRQHLEGLCGKVRAHNCPLRLLAGSTRVTTPLFCELQRWPWSAVPRNTPPQLGAVAPTPSS